MKKAVSLSQAHRLINVGPVVLVTSAHEGRQNVMAAAWTTPLCARPPLVSVAIHVGHYTHELIAASKEFVLNVPGEDLLAMVQFCGSRSGRGRDKLAEAGLTLLPATEVAAPVIAECLGHIECRLVEAPVFGDHSLFVGEVVAAAAEAELFSGTWLLPSGQPRPVHHLGSRYYGALEARISP
jgi:flavin reductase (DIM6/NTAB) family NADH-FMN oxidoreductase RutF